VTEPPALPPRFLLDRQAEGHHELLAAVEAEGFEAYPAQYRPFALDQPFDPAFARSTDLGPVLAFGTLPFLAHCRRRGPWMPGADWCSPGVFRCSNYYPRLGPWLLNGADYALYPFGDLARLLPHLLVRWGGQGVFLRPDSGLKPFDGLLVEPHLWEADLANVAGCGVAADELVLVAPPVNILAEWRLVAAGRPGTTQTVVAASRYRENGRLAPCGAVPEDVVEYGDRVLAGLAGWAPAPVWCLDVCLKANGTLRVVETTSVLAAGLYACDLRAVVRACAAAAADQWNLLRGD
jgi:hypothetical protein